MSDSGKIQGELRAEVINIVQQQSGSDSDTKSMVLRWLQILPVVAVNLLVLYALAAYFSGQTLSLPDVLGVIADSIGIVTGLLGIWFFFLSERLNRDTSANIEKTTRVVDALQNQMWSMIQTTFKTFVKDDDKEAAERAERAVKVLEEVKSNEQISPELQKAIDTLINRVETLEKNKDRISPINYDIWNSQNISNQRDLLAIKNLLVERHGESFLLDFEQLLMFMESLGYHKDLAIDLINRLERNRMIMRIVRTNQDSSEPKIFYTNWIINVK